MLVEVRPLLSPSMLSGRVNGSAVPGSRYAIADQKTKPTIACWRDHSVGASRKEAMSMPPR